MPDRSMKFKARLVQAQQSKNKTNKGEGGCGRAMPKTSLLELHLGLNPPSLVANCSFSAAPALSPGKGGLVQLCVL